MSDSARWGSTLPDPIRIEDTIASQPTLERAELTPDQQELDKQWAVKYYG